MALVEIPGLYVPPPPPPGLGVPPSFNTNSHLWLHPTQTDIGAWVFQVPRTGTLDMFEFWWQAVPTAQTVRVAFQALNSSGNPDGTDLGYRDVTPAAGWEVPGLMTDDGTDGGVKLAVTAGDWLSVTIRFTGTTGDARGGVITAVTNVWNVTNGAYLDESSASVWTKGIGGLLLGVLKYDDGAYVLPEAMLPYYAGTTTTFNSSSTPDERGLIFTPAVTMRAIGAWLYADLDNDADLVLYDTDGTTVLESLTMPAAYRGNTGAKVGMYRFAASVTLTGGDTYRLTVLPGASSVSVYANTVASAAIMASLPGGAWHLTTRSNAGSWSETTTERPQMGLIVDAVDDGAGGGGEVVSVIG